MEALDVYATAILGYIFDTSTFWPFSEYGRYVNMTTHTGSARGGLNRDT